MSIIVCSLQGRFGNQVMQYLFCRAFCEAFGHELRVEPWIGERVFDLSHPRPDGRSLPRVNEWELLANRTHAPDCEFRGYAQMNVCMVYTKRQAQSWLRLRPEVEDACQLAALGRRAGIIGHRRVGDYLGYGYPVVSEASYQRACNFYCFNSAAMDILTEENPTPSRLPKDLSFVADFYRMMTARTLLRGNSSFSWLAGLLSNGLVLSPVIDGLVGGMVHDCNFVAGNWPRFANLDFVTDLHVAP